MTADLVPCRIQGTAQGVTGGGLPCAARSPTQLEQGGMGTRVPPSTLSREREQTATADILEHFFSCVCLMASMARSVNCLGQKNAVQVHLIGAKPIVQVKR